MTPFIFLMLFGGNIPFECPQYCTEYSIRMVAECAKKARTANPNDEKNFMKDFEECLEKAKKDYLYQRCKKVCK